MTQKIELSAKAKWATALVGDELKFWYQWFATKGLHWPDDYKNRLNPDSELQEHIADFIFTDNPKILDVGSGPLTLLGKNYKGKKLDIKACDALGVQYHEMCQHFGIRPLVEVVHCEMEEITDVFLEDEFDIVYAQNCVDHCYDPIAAIEEMIKVVKPGGFVLMMHEVNEALNENWNGIHQWNFYKKGESFYISGKDVTFCVDDSFADVATIGSVVQGGYIFNIIERKQNEESGSGV